MITTVEEHFQAERARLRRLVERHPYRSNGQIANMFARFGNRWRPDDAYVEAMRVYLGKRFPENASHDYRQRVLWLAASFMGMDSHPEVSVGRKRADIVVSNGSTVVVVEVKSGRALRQAVDQVVSYRNGLGADLAIITAPDFHQQTVHDGKAAGVACMNGADTLAVLGLMASDAALNGTVAAEAVA